MASITLTFADQILNTSLQIGDTAYYVNPASHTLTDYDYTLSNPTTNPAFTENQSGNPTQLYQSFGDENTNMTELGMVTAIDQDTNTITTYIPTTTNRPTQNVSFILFSKDAQANMSSLMGYYAEVKFINNSNTYAELYAISSEVVESSK